MCLQRKMLFDGAVDNLWQAKIDNNGILPYGQMNLILPLLESNGVKTTRNMLNGKLRERNLGVTSQTVSFPNTHTIKTPATISVINDHTSVSSIPHDGFEHDKPHGRPKETS